MKIELATTYKAQPMAIAGANQEMQALASVYELILQKSRDRQKKMTLEANSGKIDFVLPKKLKDSLGAE